MKTATFLLTASLLLAMALTFSCSSDGDDSGGGEGTSSSSAGGNRSSSGGYTGPYGSLPYEGKTYKTVVIGSQTWMAENLNYNAKDSKCYDNQDSNCNTYGRLYNWVTAMALPVNCQITSCASQVNAKHKGICPVGWHIPNSSDWDILMNYVQTDNGSTYTSGSTASIAGRYLKATSGWGWNIYADWINCNGEDKYGFAALPGGEGTSSRDRSFTDVGISSYWWSASENNSHSAYYRGSTVGESVYWLSYDKIYLYSVRCAKD